MFARSISTSRCCSGAIAPLAILQCITRAPGQRLGETEKVTHISIRFFCVRCCSV